MKCTLFIVCLIGAVLGQTTSPSAAPTITPNYTALCIDDTSSSFDVEGDYHFYTTYGDYAQSIWIQQTSGEAYIIYFDEALGNEYQAWGFYKCDLASYYREFADESTDKSPATKEGCQGEPVLFCPALDDDDANSLGDGQSPADGTLDYNPADFTHFYECSNWFAYENGMSYPSGELLSWTLWYQCDDDDGNSNNGGGVVGPGEKTDNGSDAVEESKMSSGAKAVLWIILSIFIVACVVFIVYFAYHWKQKHDAELGQSMTTGTGDGLDAPAPRDDGNTLETAA